MTNRKTAVLAAAGALALVALADLACRKTMAPREAAAASAPAAQRFHCPMHPSYVSDKAGDCPICGMKLVPVAPAPAEATPAAGAEGTGRAPLTLSADRRRMLGVGSTPVRSLPLSRDIRTSGRVAVDERRLHHVHAKYDAYVEHLHVDFTGRFVRRGEPLLSLYSPDLVATQEEYLLAARAERQLAGGTVAEAARGASGLLEAARQRLLLWDIRPADIERLEQTGRARRTLDLYSPVSGYVVQKTAYHGMRVTPADTLFDIADLSSVWVLADVYESDLGAVRVGMPAQVGVTYLPGRTWAATVRNVAPTLDEKTRTVQVRLDVGNRGGELKPEMYADVVLRADSGQGLVVPEGAVVHAGERDLVFVERPDGTLDPRPVRLGARVAEGRHVLHGLAEGEAVVSSANFLLDSESSLRSALAASSPAAEHRH